MFTKTAKRVPTVNTPSKVVQISLFIIQTRKIKEIITPIGCLKVKLFYLFKKITLYKLIIYYF